MQFSIVLQTIQRFLESIHHPCAVIGGLGMVAYGMPRTTLDVDIVVPGEAQKQLLSFLGSQGYEALHVSEGYSNHLHRNPEKGRVDVIYVRGKTCRDLFADSRSVVGPEGLTILVLRPEHLAAMKIFAIKNNPSRTFQDLDDIRFLLTLPEVDREEIKQFFIKYGLEELYEEVQKTL